MDNTPFSAREASFGRSSSTDLTGRVTRAMRTAFSSCFIREMSCDAVSFFKKTDGAIGCILCGHSLICVVRYGSHDQVYGSHTVHHAGYVHG